MLNLTGQLEMLGLDKTKRRLTAEGATPVVRAMIEAADRRLRLLPPIGAQPEGAGTGKTIWVAAAHPHHPERFPNRSG